MSTSTFTPFGLTLSHQPYFRMASFQEAADVDVFAVDEQAVLLEMRVPLEGEKEHLLTLRFQRLTQSNVVTVEAEKVHLVSSSSHPFVVTQFPSPRYHMCTIYP